MALSFKAVYLFHRTSCSNFCLKSAVLNARKHLHQSHFNLTILQQQFTINFLEEQLHPFALARLEQLYFLQ